LARAKRLWVGTPLTPPCYAPPVAGGRLLTTPSAAGFVLLFPFHLLCWVSVYHSFSTFYRICNPGPPPHNYPPSPFPFPASTPQLLDDPKDTLFPCNRSIGIVKTHHRPPPPPPTKHQTVLSFALLCFGFFFPSMFLSNIGQLQTTQGAPPHLSPGTWS